VPGFTNRPPLRSYRIVAAFARLLLLGSLSVIEISEIQKELSRELKNGPLPQAKLDEFSQRLAACEGVNQAVSLPGAVLNRVIRL